MKTDKMVVTQNQSEPFMLYEQPLNQRIVLTSKPILHGKAFGFVFVGCYDTLIEACEKAEELKEENEEEDNWVGFWSIEELY